MVLFPSNSYKSTIGLDLQDLHVGHKSNDKFARVKQKKDHEVGHLEYLVSHSLPEKVFLALRSVSDGKVEIEVTYHN